LDYEINPSKLREKREKIARILPVNIDAYHILLGGIGRTIERKKNGFAATFRFLNPFQSVKSGASGQVWLLY